MEWRLVKVRRGNQRGRGSGQERGGRRTARPREGDEA
jgi:hypothetical protein